MPFSPSITAVDTSHGEEPALFETRRRVVSSTQSVLRRLLSLKRGEEETVSLRDSANPLWLHRKKGRTQFLPARGESSFLSSRRGSQSVFLWLRKANRKRVLSCFPRHGKRNPKGVELQRDGPFRFPTRVGRRYRVPARQGRFFPTMSGRRVEGRIRCLTGSK